MKAARRHSVWFALLGLFSLQSKANSQITANEGDGVLNAPYRGTIDSLRECSADIGYGEVKSHIEPSIFCTTQNPDPCEITSGTIDVWFNGTWDRSVLRMYEGLDASGSEIDLTGTSEGSPETVFTDGTVKRFSFKAIGTKTLAPQTFTIHLSYELNGLPINDATREIKIAPITGSFCASQGESEAFLPGTPILDVQVGNAKLTVPVGRTAEMIGATFIDKAENIALTGVSTNDVLFPGSAESVQIQSNDQFRLGASSSAKTGWGTPWPGYLVGYQINIDPFGPDGMHFDSLTGASGGPGFTFRRVDFIRPAMQSETLPASVRYNYDNGFDNHVIEIRDQATPPNVITLTRTAGVVTGISTSDGRGWTIVPDPNGWIASITPTGGNGKRSFTYNSAGRVTQVKDANNALMYEFTYVNDGSGNPTILTAEKRFVDNAMQTVVQHEVVSESLQRRKVFTGPGEFRQFDFNYDTANNLKHRLASITSYENVNGGAPSRTTTYTHDVNNAAGSMVVTQVALPDGSTIAHEHDAHIGAQTVDFGFRTKSTRTGPDDGSLVTFDATHEFFYCSNGATSCTSGQTRLFHRPRIVKQRDGRHLKPPDNLNTEVTFDYDNGGVFVDGFTDVLGQDLNRLLSIVGPTINTGPSAPRTPETRFIYDNSGVFPTYLLLRRETKFNASTFRVTAFGYDPLRRLTTQTVDPSVESILTQFLYCDTAATQDRIVVVRDPDAMDLERRYWTRTRFDINGRVTTTERFLNPNAGNVSTPCVDPAGPFYKTTNSDNSSGFLQQQTIENKGQDGVVLPPPHSATIATTFSPDRLGRVTLQTVDSGGINQESNFDYNWLGEIERQFDTSSRGTKRTYDGRGLVKTETPLAVTEEPDTNLTTTFTYDAMANLLVTDGPTRPSGAQEERVYDDFDRPEQIIRHPGTDGGNTITTTFEYDKANHVTRTVVAEGSLVLSDSTAKFDEGGLNYETRQRTVFSAIGSDTANDPLTERRFDWAGNVVEERALGDVGPTPTVLDRVLTTDYDGANRVRKITGKDSAPVPNLLSETTITPDDRGNVTEQSVKIEGSNSAVTTTVYDALSRAIQVTSPEDGVGGRPDRIRRYDSRGNLLRETIRDAADVPKLTTVFGYDNAGRQTRQAALAVANVPTTFLAANAVKSADRVVDSVYDADGRLLFRHQYNNDTSVELTTETTYDDLGRVDRVTDPPTGTVPATYTDVDYATNGRLSQRVIFDGVGTRTFTFGYDGHDRIKEQTALGPPDLVTMFTLDGLDRQTRITDPKGIATRTDIDLVGRRKTLVEDDGGALQRQTDFAYNRLGQLVTQTAHNKKFDGTSPTTQVTKFRYDSFGRQVRVVYPDSAENPDNPNCTDCVRQTFDLASRLTQRTLQYLPPAPPPTTTFTYDDRGLLLTRSTGTDRDTFAYDAVGRITLADRGTTVGPNQDAVSHSAMSYTTLGDLDFETQAIAEGTAQTTDYSYDQAGNRKTLIYPGLVAMTYTPTALNQVDQIKLGTVPSALTLVDYAYQGRLLDMRKAFTNPGAAGPYYEHDVGYDAHRRTNAMTNRFQPASGQATTIADYSFNHDANGNPLTQTVLSGMAAFVTDDRAFTVDRLSRLTGTQYLSNEETESTTLDRIGNRQSHTDRTGTVTTYGTVNTANEYPAIGGISVSYNPAGNLSVDQAGRQYTYDEHNRLTQVKNASNSVLASYTYDALGRRITSNVDGTITRFYYDGQTVIEERNAADTRVRYHVNGSQYIDERVATYSDASAAFAYYLGGNNFSVTGTGNANGSSITRLDYSATGDFAGGGPVASAYYHDAENDVDIDLRDFANFQRCFDPTPPVSSQSCLDAHDFGAAGADNVIDLRDCARISECLNGPFVTPDQACGRPQRGVTPTSGAFTLHGRPADLLSDGHTLMDFRARTYLPVLGRWLQRDPRPYINGPSLYEAFGGNPLIFQDPLGTAIGDWWDPRTYYGTFWQGYEEAYVNPFAEAVASVHADMAGADVLDPWETVVILVEELPARQIGDREASIAALEGRPVDFSQGHMTWAWVRHQAGVNAMTDALVGVSLTTGEEIIGADAVAQFSGGLSTYMFTASLGVSGGQLANQAARSANVARAAYISGRPLGYSLRLGMHFSRPYPVLRGATGVAAAREEISARPLTGEQLVFSFAEPTLIPAGTLSALPRVPRYYSVAFETRLAQTEFGLSQGQHFDIANSALQAERAMNPALASIVPEPVAWGRPPTGWTWQHATIQQGGGRAGVMQLVPRAQHTPGSPYWPLFHPLPGGAGGYWEWAVPAGARPR